MLIRRQIFSWGPNISNIYCESVGSYHMIPANHRTAVHAGLGKHLEAIDRPQLDVLRDWFKRLYAFEFLYTLAVSTLKFSM